MFLVGLYRVSYGSNLFLLAVHVDIASTLLTIYYV